MEGDFVLLKSADGFTFVVSRKIAMASGTMKSMLEDGASFAESESNTVDLAYRGVIVLKVIEYLAYKVQYADSPTEDITEDFTDRIDPYIALELLTAADFLEA